MRTSVHLAIPPASRIKDILLRWAQQYEEICWLDSNAYPHRYSTYEAVLAVDAFTVLQTDWPSAFDQLEEYQRFSKDWLFGYLSYDLKNDTEQLNSQNEDQLDFPDLFFFQPRKLLWLKEDKLTLSYLYSADDELEEDATFFKNQLTKQSNEDLAVTRPREKPLIRSKISRKQFIQKIKKLQSHIQNGDVYEANLCQEFYIEQYRADVVQLYQELNQISRPPFATFFRTDQRYILSASPERYLKKEGQTLISQPIKGTARREPDSQRDRQSSQQLREDPKEQSENVMIVDLVRNDLSRTALPGSVEVEELFEIYTFDQVHQMISTVRSEIRPDVSPVNCLRTTFPMGSMTGAPKIRAMQLIEELEESKRGVYSGAVGYFTPDGNFDFNVVIRSLLYNQEKQYISFSVGSAITAQSVPEKEYEECLLKAKAMREVL